MRGNFYSDNPGRAALSLANEGFTRCPLTQRPAPRTVEKNTGNYYVS
jgi:hypothetical protein